METYVDPYWDAAENRRIVPVDSKRVDMPGRTSKSHVPENSMLFERVVPALLIFMGILTVVLILFAAGVLLGIVHF